jgi:alkylation response protein AidB-like acyl-CoA dehydrogenase
VSSAPDSQSVSRTAAATPSRPGLVALAKGLAPVLRERAAETNRLRRLPDSTWKDLIQTGILRGLQPARWGGGEVRLGEFYSAISEVARAEGCAGWVAGIIGVHPWHVALFPKETQEEMWSEDPTAMNSSSYAPTGAAQRVAGGFRLIGRWSFSSGCDHCKWVVLGAVVGTAEIEGRQLPALHSFYCSARITASTTTGTSPAWPALAARISWSTAPSSRSIEASRIGPIRWAARVPDGS